MNSLANIKQIIGSMESGVTVDNVKDFQRQVADLETQVRGNASAASFGKMLHSIGKYLASEIDNAHKDTVPVLRTLVELLDSLVNLPRDSPGKADEILARGIQSFKRFKAGISEAPQVSEKEIEALKAVILSIDWEISDITLKSFNSVIKPLASKMKFHKIHSSFLKIMQSIGGYVARNKADAHKDSIALLHSVFQSYERLVRNPDMTAADQKQMLEANIRAFHQFKREIARPPRTTPVQDPADEEVAPALSHLKAAPSTGDPVPLNILPEEEISFPASHRADDDIPPALADKEKKASDSRDMLDDLFMAKESPADKLLDAIHMAEIHGPDQEYGMDMPGAAEDTDQKEGVHSFTPQRMDKEPIQEIESSLDAFFNLDASEKKIEAPAVDTDQSMENDRLADGAESEPPDDQEAVVPFQYEDESFEEEDEDQASRLLERLRACLKNPGGLTEETVFTAFTEDVSLLKAEWREDPDKVSLLELLASLARYSHAPEKGDLTVPETRPDAEIQMETVAEEGAADSAEPNAGGFWTKIKSLFRN
ncbi:MAG: hypothetical protein GY737_23175 [Desulfobacteraceae bacterium]|nr:hypothetical protein [Desulfobacteraceae bacterium]